MCVCVSPACHKLSTGIFLATGSNFSCRNSGISAQRRLKTVYLGTLTLSIKIAQKPYIMNGVFGPKALKYESFEGKGKALGPGV